MQLSPQIYHSLVRPRWFTQKYIHNQINKHCNLKNKYVLDFGAGTGKNCELSTPDFYLGLDPDEKRINFAKKKYHQYQFNILNNHTLPIQDQSIDVILIIAVLHHIPQDMILGYLKEFRRILKNHDSEIIILEPCLLNKKCLKNWFMRTFDKGDYLQNEQSYLNMFKGAGFQTTKISQFPKFMFYNELLFKAKLSK
ncbi:class I SAM-dependent methyltransferase [Tenuibacillus multivorans]|uniref:Methyltransferase domain-containing protein n=1 Tax=Tenuibacillus multivorans TaxID=237069 RepID=A0A1H0B135_9BACI|nr:class I SAM-dependent methyltransferase [Tenuibacillus multivorans]GEL77573.1 hypothetical protein TMU01_18080 [Tenuibacillus multivorans]SDN39392.1 Methyltransferase domain-containing protein [Tenuibacillus multivorans]